MTVKLSIGWIQSNSKLVSWPSTGRIKLYTKASISVVILPIEKYKLLNQVIGIQHSVVVDVKFFVIFFRRKRMEWPSNCRWEYFNEIQNYLCRRINDVFNSKRMSKYLRCDFAEWKMKLNSPRGSFIVVVVISKFFANYFHQHTFQRPSNYWWENSAKCRANL